MNTRSLLLAATLAAALSGAEADPVHPVVAALPLDQLKTAYLACDRATTQAALPLVDFQRCSVIGDDLLQRGFGGDFDRLLAWWRIEKVRFAQTGTGSTSVP